jgi:hypothetical protein
MKDCRGYSKGAVCMLFPVGMKRLKLRQMIRFIALCIMAVILLMPNCSIAEELKVVTAEGRAILGDDKTPAEAKAIALNNARRNALETAVGVTIRGSTVVYNSSLINDLVVAATKGLIVKENIIDHRWDPLEDGRMSWFTRIEAHVKPLKTENRGNYKIVKALVQRPDKDTEMSVPVFQQDDEVQIKVKANKDSFINIFCVDQNGSITKLYPNQYMPAELLPSRTELAFPSDKQRAMGMRIKVTTLKGLSKSLESVLIVATKDQVDFLSEGTPETPTITDLMKQLSSLDIAFWTEKTIGYEVHK